MKSYILVLLANFQMVFLGSRTAKHIHCVQDVNIVRLCTAFIKIKQHFQICHILWHFKDAVSAAFFLICVMPRNRNI